MPGTVTHPNQQIQAAALDFIAGLEELVAKPKHYGRLTATIEGADTKLTGQESGIIWRKRLTPTP